ncbi:MAG TPA: hypothetical protein VK722_02160 [Candidatus Aquilonibacter sp.]|nr:hypothetical protein [Candidatus Aquilonibacter sp.]
MNERGQRLRLLDFNEIARMADAPVEQLSVQSRPSTIGIFVERQANGNLLVVLQGFMKARYVPFVKHVALDGFYKHPDNSITPLPPEEFYRFD